MVFGQKLGGVGVAGVEAVGVFDIEIVVARLDVGNGYAPGEFTFLTVVPPTFFQVKLVDADGASFGVFFVAWGEGMLEIPGLLGGLAFGEEEEIGIDVGVGGEDAIG